jgi:hypothetical protein
VGWGLGQGWVELRTVGENSKTRKTKIKTEKRQRNTTTRQYKTKNSKAAQHNTTQQKTRLQKTRRPNPHPNQSFINLSWRVSTPRKENTNFSLSNILAYQTNFY